MIVSDKNQRPFSIDGLQRFYIENSFSILKSFRKPFVMSAIVLSCEFYSQLFIGFSMDLINYLNKQDTLFYLFQYVLLFQTFSMQSFIFWVLFGLNVAVVLRVIFNYVLFCICKFDHPIIDKPLSILVSIYIPVFLMPEFFFSLNQGNIEGYVNLILSIIIGVLTGMHDYAYEFRDIDSLCRRKSFFSVMKVLTKLICAFIHVYSSYLYHPISPLITSALSLLDFFREIPYYDIRISSISLQLALANTFISIILLLGVNIDTFKSIFFTVFILVALSFKIGSSLFTIFQQNIMSKFSLNLEEINWKQDVQVSQLDFYIRTLSDESISLHYEDYMKSKMQVFLQTIILDHISRCTKTQEQCYCKEYSKQIQEQNGMVNKKFLLGESERKNFLKDYILEMFEKYLEKNGQNLQALHVEFFFFLHDYINNPTKAIILLHNTLQEKGKEANIQQRALLSYVQHLLSKDYYINQKQLYKERFDTFDLQMVLDYDDKIKDFQNQLITALDYKREFLSIISKDVINLETTVAEGQKLIVLRKKLHQDLIWFNRVNSNNKLQEKLLDLYVMNLSFGDYKSSFYRKQRKFINKQQDEDLFGDSQCVMYISLLKGSLGEIKRVSDQFSQIFQTPVADVLNKNCSLVMPPQIGKIHNEFLQQMIERGSIHERRLKTFKLLFGISKQDFAIPLEVNIKLDYMSMTEFGVSALIKHRIHSDQNYILLDGFKSQKIYRVTEDLYEGVLKKTVKKEEIEKIYIDQLIPVLSGYINKRLEEEKQLALNSNYNAEMETQENKNIVDEQILDTVCFIPNSKGNLRLFRKMVDLEKDINDPVLFNVMENEMFQLRIAITFLDHEDVKQVYVQVKNFRLLKRVSDKKFELNTLQAQLKKYCNVNYNLDINSSVLKVSQLFSARNFQGSLKKLEDLVGKSDQAKNQKSSFKELDTSSVISDHVRRKHAESIYQAQSAQDNIKDDESESQKSQNSDDTPQVGGNKQDDTNSVKSSNSYNQSTLFQHKLNSNKKSNFSLQDTLNPQHQHQQNYDLLESGQRLSNGHIHPKSTNYTASHNTIEEKRNRVNSKNNLASINEIIKESVLDKNDFNREGIHYEFVPLTPKTPLTSYRLDINMSSPTQAGLISPVSQSHIIFSDINEPNPKYGQANKLNKISEISTNAAVSSIAQDHANDNKTHAKQNHQIKYFHDSKADTKQLSKMEESDEYSKKENQNNSIHSFKAIQQKLMNAQKQIKSLFKNQKRKSTKRLTRFSQKFLAQSDDSEQIRQQNNNNDQSSVTSQLDNQFYAKKQFLIEKIKSQKYSSSLIVINSFSLLSLGIY